MYVCFTLEWGGFQGMTTCWGVVLFSSEGCSLVSGSLCCVLGRKLFIITQGWGFY